MTRTKLGFVCFVAARNCMRQQVAGRSSQRHATLPTYYKVVLRTEKVLLCTTLYYKVLIQYYSVLQSTTPVLLCTTPVLLDPRPIRPWSDHETVVRNPPRNRGYFSRPPRAFCIEKYNISRSGCHSKFHRILRLPRKVTLQLHQILRLPRKMNLMIDPCHTWNAIYNARSNKCHCPNSPNTAPATKNESHDWSLSHMKRYLQCAD